MDFACWTLKNVYIFNVYQAHKWNLSTVLSKKQLDAILSKNNYYAAHAAIAFYPCLTVPMGYTDDGEPANLTFMAPSFSDSKLLKLGAAYERISNHRKSPEGYQ